MAYFGKLARMSETTGLVGDLRVEPSDSIKIRLKINREETIDRARRTTRRINVDLWIDIDPMEYVRSLFREIIRYLRNRQKAIEEEKGEGYIEILESTPE